MKVSELKLIINQCKQDLDNGFFRRINNYFYGPSYPASVNSLEAFLTPHLDPDHEFNTIERFWICSILFDNVKGMTHSNDVWHADYHTEPAFYFEECVMFQNIRRSLIKGVDWRQFMRYFSAIKSFMENHVDTPGMMKALDSIASERPDHISDWSKTLIEIFQLGFKEDQWVDMIVTYLINIVQDDKNIVPALKRLREANIVSNDTMTCLFNAPINFSTVIDWFVKLQSAGILTQVITTLSKLVRNVCSGWHSFSMLPKTIQEQTLRINLIVCSWIRLAEKSALTDDTLQAIQHTPPEQIEDMTRAILLLHADGNLTVATLSFLEKLNKMPVSREQIAQSIVSMGIEGLPVEACLNGLLRTDREATISLFAYLNKFHLIGLPETTPLMDACNWTDSAKFQQQLERLDRSMVTADLFKLMCKHDADPMLTDILLLLYKERHYNPPFVKQLMDSSNPLPWMFRWLQRFKQEGGLTAELVAIVPAADANAILSQRLKSVATAEAAVSITASVAQSTLLYSKKTHATATTDAPAVRLAQG